MSDGSETPKDVVPASVEETKSFQGDLSVPSLSIPGYVVEKMIGQGGSATVYEASPSAGGACVAIKVFKNKDQFHTQRFQNEADALRLLNDMGLKHVVHLIGFGECQGFPYIVMKCYQESAQQFVPHDKGKDLGISAQKITNWIYKISKDLYEIHRVSRLHRDIKPSNILIEDNEPFLSDFGLVKAIDDDFTSLTQSNTILGSAFYMSPEQALGQELSIASDIYSLGATYYALLSGSPPYAEVALTSEAFFNFISRYPPKPLEKVLPKIDPNVNRIVMKCLNRSPKHRYRNAKELAEDCKRSLIGAAVEAENVHLERIRLFRKRNWLSLVFVLFLAMFVGVLSLVIHDSQRSQRISEIDVAFEALRGDAAEINKVLERSRNAALNSDYRAATAFSVKALQLYRRLVIPNSANEYTSRRDRYLSLKAEFESLEEEVNRQLRSCELNYSCELRLPGNKIRKKVVLQSSGWFAKELSSQTVEFTDSHSLNKLVYQSDSDISLIVASKSDLGFLIGHDDGYLVHVRAKSGKVVTERTFRLPAQHAISAIYSSVESSQILVGTVSGAIFLCSGAGVSKLELRNEENGKYQPKGAIVSVAGRWTSDGLKPELSTLAVSTAKKLSIHRASGAQFNFVWENSLSGYTSFGPLEFVSSEHLVVFLSAGKNNGRMWIVNPKLSECKQCGKLPESEFRNLAIPFKAHSVSVSHSGQVLAIALDDGTLRLINIFNELRSQSLSRIQILNKHAHYYAATDLCFSQDDQILYSCNEFGEVKAWNVGLNVPSKSFRDKGAQKFYTITLSPRKDILGAIMLKKNESPERIKILKFGKSRSLQLQEVASFPTDSEKLSAMAFSPNGDKIVTVGREGRVTLRSLAGKIISQREMIGENFNCVSWTKKGIFAGGMLGKLYYFKHNLTLSENRPLVDNDNNPDALFRVGNSQGKILFGLRSGRLLQVAVEEGALITEFLPFRHKSEVTAIQFSPSGKLLATGSGDGEIYVTKVLEHRFEKQVQFQAHERMSWSFCFSPEENHLLSGGGDKRIVLWDLGWKRQVLVLPNNSAAIRSLFLIRDTLWVVTKPRVDFLKTAVFSKLNNETQYRPNIRSIQSRLGVKVVGNELVEIAK